ncbi:MAG TPA: hypothetical protein VH496_16425 [Mycobacterium sp.]
MVSLVIALLIFVGLIYGGWRLILAARNARPKTRVIGPDDDPEFLWRLGQDGDPKP